MEFDVAVVGGGINGAGVARESAYRGYRTLLLEKDDFAQATSSQSTKMIHGGIRYLETGDFHLVWESLRERWVLLQIAPHLVKPLEIVIPTYADFARPLWLVRLGTFIYDMLAGRKNIGRSYTLTAEQLQALPGLQKEGLRGAVAYTDAQVFDARLCLETALSAKDSGAVVLNYHPVERVSLVDGRYLLEGTNRRNGELFRFAARSVVNATGPWTPFFEQQTLRHETKPMVYDRGIHLVIPSIGMEVGLALMISDGRLIFVLPWQGEFTLVGTTETQYEGRDFTDIAYEEEEVTYLLDAFNECFPDRHLQREEVLYVYSGVRSLIAGHGLALTKLSREAEIEVHADSPEATWMNVYGGKLTSYRALAARALKKLAPRLPPPAGPQLRFTERTPLYGGGEIVEIPAAKTPAFLTPELQACWRGRYGSNWVELVDLCLARPELQEMLLKRFQFTRADLVYMVTFEMAFTLEDLTFRRTKMIYSLTEEETRRLSGALADTLNAQQWDTLYDKGQA